MAYSHFKSTLRAVLSSVAVSNAKRYDNKELVRSYTLVACNAGDWRELVDIRCWMGRSRSASTVYAAAWIFGDDARKIHWCSGSGNAGGYGYDKCSAAIAGALRSAGVKLYGKPSHLAASQNGVFDADKEAHIDGTGDSAVEAAIYAIGEAMGYTLDQMHLVVTRS